MAQQPDRKYMGADRRRVKRTVQYIGAVAGAPGLDQLNLIVPKSLAGAGEVPVVLTTGGQTANVVTINIQ